MSLLESYKKVLRVVHDEISEDPEINAFICNILDQLYWKMLIPEDDYREMKNSIESFLGGFYTMNSFYAERLLSAEEVIPIWQINHRRVEWLKNKIKELDNA